MNKKKIIIILIVAAVVVYIYMSQTPSSTSTDSESSGLFSQAIKALNEAKGKLNETKSELDTIKTEQQNKLTQEEIEARKNIEEMRRIARGLYDDIYSTPFLVVDDYIEKDVKRISDGALKVVAEEFQKISQGNVSLYNAIWWKPIIGTYSNYDINSIVYNYKNYLPTRLSSLGLM